MSLIEYLPAIYQDPTDGDEAGGRLFLRDFLSAFERLLLSSGGAHRPAVDPEPLEDEIARIPALFDAERAPEQFLNWLAGWVALRLRADLSVDRKRRLVANIARLYRIRGTRRYLEEVLKLYLDALPSVTDQDLPALQITDHSTVGADTYLGGGPAFLFQVKLAFSRDDGAFVEQQRQLAREIIDLERPAHTWYDLKVIFPRMQLGVQSTVGVDTVLAP